MTDDEIFQKICDDINALMPARNRKHEAFERALASIEAAISRKVSVDEISKIFAKYDIEIAPSTIRQHLRKKASPQNSEEIGQKKAKSRRKRTKKSSTRAKPKKAKSHSPDEASQAEAPVSADVSAEPKQSRSGKIHKDF